MQTSVSSGIQAGKRSMTTDANRAYLLWSNSRVPLADAIERVCDGKPTSYKLTVTLICEAKFEQEKFGAT